MKMRDNIPIMMPNAVTPMVGCHMPDRRGRHALNAHTHTHGADTTTGDIP